MKLLWQWTKSVPTIFKETTKFFPILWFLLPAILAFNKWRLGSVNNYAIYKGVFTHLLQQVNLYALYPLQHDDSNHYGPLFGLIIMPFAQLPDALGVVLWVSFQAFVLYKALGLLPIKPAFQWVLFAICLVDLMTASASVQVNPSVIGMIILSWYFVKKDQVIWATLFVMIGFFIKLYGIVGLAFWVFSDSKIKYIGYCVMWAIVLFVLPMTFSSPEFIVQSYQDWFESLTHKHTINQGVTNGVGATMQDVSLMGLVRRIGGFPNIPGAYFIIPGFILQIIPLLRFKQYRDVIFQLRYLASLAIFVVIFSSSSESPTFIIAVSGVAIWFISQEYPIQNWVKILLVLVVIITSLSATDIFPKNVRQIFIIYSIKAFPCCLIWFVCIYQLLFVETTKMKSLWLNQN
ncbi:MAG: glycosyltransferase family 87 protein [Arcicella sp.]|nr:glycosyltransferase family 87 protein [Arcicella sp.]